MNQQLEILPGADVQAPSVFSFGFSTGSKMNLRLPSDRFSFWGGPLALIHWFAILAARRRSGWVYFLPLGLLLIIVIAALSGGIHLAYCRDRIG